MAAADLAIVGRILADGGPARRGTVLVREGRIEAVRPGDAGKEADRTIDLGDAYLLPGAIDCHVHSGSHPGEGIAALTCSAAAGGVTTVVDMPYDAGAPVVDPAVFAEKSDRVRREAVVDVALLATVAPGTGASSVAGLVAAGAVGFKLSLFCTDPQRFPRIRDAQFLEVLAAIRSADSIACVHAENEEIIKPLIERLRDSPAPSPIDHCRSRPPVSETQAVLTALEYARETGARLHLCHLSVPRSVDLARRYAEEDVLVSVETCPHYLCFSELDMERLGGRVKINPPVRSLAFREELLGRVLGGSVDVVGSDHAPWPLAQKTQPHIFDNHSGAPGVETLLPVLATTLLSHGGTLHDLVRLLSAAPARLFGLTRKGTLADGMDADVVALDTSAPYKLDERSLHSNAGWSPYDGMTLEARVVATFARGELVWDGSQVCAAPGRGRLVTRAGEGASDD